MQKELAFPFVIHDGQGYTYTSSSAVEDTPSSDAQKWIQDFQNSQAGQAALTELASDKQLARIIQRLNIQKDFPRFQELLLLECYWAHQYQATGDHIWGVISKEWRRQNDANAELAKVVGRASERIETLYHANPWHVSEYVKPAYEKIIGPLPKEQHTERLIDLLNALREALENDQGRAASAHRYGIGCLAYDRAVKDRNRPKNEVRTGLEFSIALRFKQFTRTNHPYRLDIFGLGRGSAQLRRSDRRSCGDGWRPGSLA